MDMDECYTHDGHDYAGAVNVTRTGTPCVPWVLMGMAAMGTDLEGAFCRNPDGKRAPWCFTNVRKREWDFCQMVAPPSDEPCAGSRLAHGECAPMCTASKLANQRCDGACNVAACNFDNNMCEDTECFSDARGLDYRGTIFKTASGRTCQNWKTVYPHYHEYDAVGDHNFCRNPDNYSAPWCFTMDFSVRWEACLAVKAFWKAEGCRSENRTRSSSARCPRECANLLGDGTCDRECDVFGCLWDGGDCEDVVLQLGRRFDIDVSRMHRYSQDARVYVSDHLSILLSVFVGGCCGATLVLCFIRRAREHRRRLVREGRMPEDQLALSQPDEGSK